VKALNNDAFTWKPHMLNEMYRSLIPQHYLGNQHQGFVDQHGHIWQMMNPHQLNEADASEFTDEAQEINLRG
jgi:hypothetical protein